MTTYSIRDWFSQWEGLIGAVDFGAARELFADDVVGFGTVARVVHGLDELEERQWRSVWSKISDFRFDLDSLDLGLSQDRLHGWGACLWSSTGFRPDGSEFHRPGRCTVFLARQETHEPWRAVHTHFSLVPAPAPGR